MGAIQSNAIQICLGLSSRFSRYDRQVDATGREYWTQRTAQVTAPPTPPHTTHTTTTTTTIARHPRRRPSPQVRLKAADLRPLFTEPNTLIRITTFSLARARARSLSLVRRRAPSPRSATPPRPKAASRRSSCCRMPPTPSHDAPTPRRWSRPILLPWPLRRPLPTCTMTSTSFNYFPTSFCSARPLVSADGRHHRAAARDLHFTARDSVLIGALPAVPWRIWDGRALAERRLESAFQRLSVIWTWALFWSFLTCVTAPCRSAHATAC